MEVTMSNFLKVTVNQKPLNLIKAFFPDVLELNIDGTLLMDLPSEQRRSLMKPYFLDKGIDYNFILEKEEVFGYSIALIETNSDISFFLIPVLNEKIEELNVFFNTFNFVSAVETIAIDDAKVLYYQYKL
jgi:hypothetical protein